MSRDPAFLFYDGDAARDVSHMSRLERGCYFDLIQFQRKAGRMTLDQIQTVLGKDFESCWKNVQICLSYDNHMYFIEWVEESTKKRNKYSEGRKNNRLGKKSNHMKNICESYEKHMENEIENEKEIKNVVEIPSHLVDVWPHFLEMRKKIKKPMTDHAQRLAFSELEKISKSNKEQVAIVEQSIRASWQGLFPLREQKQTARQQQESEQYQQPKQPLPIIKL
jgi:hypothetical protein